MNGTHFELDEVKIGDILCVSTDGIMKIAGKTSDAFMELVVKREGSSTGARLFKKELKLEYQLLFALVNKKEVKRSDLYYRKCFANRHVIESADRCTASIKNHIDKPLPASARMDRAGKAHRGWMFEWLKESVLKTELLKGCMARQSFATMPFLAMVIADDKAALPLTFPHFPKFKQQDQHVQNVKKHITSISNLISITIHHQNIPHHLTQQPIGVGKSLKTGLLAFLRRLEGVKTISIYNGNKDECSAMTISSVSYESPTVPHMDTYQNIKLSRVSSQACTRFAGTVIDAVHNCPRYRTTRKSTSSAGQTDDAPLGCNYERGQPSAGGTLAWATRVVSHVGLKIQLSEVSLHARAGRDWASSGVANTYNITDSWADIIDEEEPQTVNPLDQFYSEEFLQWRKLMGLDSPTSTPDRRQMRDQFQIYQNLHPNVAAQSSTSTSKHMVAKSTTTSPSKSMVAKSTIVQYPNMATQSPISTSKHVVTRITTSSLSKPIIAKSTI
ncbi:hypothetical protein RND71_024986 [Anisodus tanguticus]|uniref:Uncharacterized protein n=1 Tax=Anisodus tanguticus TaxID=243964 RepID=A0AAE1RPC0_9SOLA|nr:hypothetical protein RND71_024986 [Anisodus tanguticus]